MRCGGAWRQWRMRRGHVSRNARGPCAMQRESMRKGCSAAQTASGRDTAERHSALETRCTTDSRGGKGKKKTQSRRVRRQHSAWSVSASRGARCAVPPPFGEHVSESEAALSRCTQQLRSSSRCTTRAPLQQLPRVHLHHGCTSMPSSCGRRSTSDAHRDVRWRSTHGVRPVKRTAASAQGGRARRRATGNLPRLPVRTADARGS